MNCPESDLELQSNGTSPGQDFYVTTSCFSPDKYQRRTDMTVRDTLRNLAAAPGAATTKKKRQDENREQHGRVSKQFAH